VACLSHLRRNLPRHAIDVAVGQHLDDVQVGGRCARDPGQAVLHLSARESETRLAAAAREGVETARPAVPEASAELDVVDDRFRAKLAEEIAASLRELPNQVGIAISGEEALVQLPELGRPRVPGKPRAATAMAPRMRGSVGEAGPLEKAIRGPSISRSAVLPSA
jgi:hypothetical protein